MCGCGGGRSGEAAHVLGGGGDRGGRGGERLVARLTSSWAEAGVVARGTLSWVVVGVAGEADLVLCGGWSGGG